MCERFTNLRAVFSATRVSFCPKRVLLVSRNCCRSSDNRRDFPSSSETLRPSDSLSSLSSLLLSVSRLRFSTCEIRYVHTVHTLILKHFWCTHTPKNQSAHYCIARNFCKFRFIFCLDLVYVCIQCMYKQKFSHECFHPQT